MSAIKMPPWCRYLKMFNMASTSCVAVLILLSIWFEDLTPEDLLLKIIASYLTVLIASAIIYKINAPRDEPQDKTKA